MHNIFANFQRPAYRVQFFMFLAALMVSHPTHVQATPTLDKTDTRKLAEELRVGDIVFIHVDVLPFRKIARDTGSWTNHVGIVVELSGTEPLIAESTFPFSKIGPISKFLKRSKEGRVAVVRLNAPLESDQLAAFKPAALKRVGIFYDAGFNLHSRRQFCSRYVREVVQEATGIQLGTVETLKALFSVNPNADLGFWRLWYFGRIPWERETVTPASILNSPDLHNVFDGYAKI
jgi:hypothetical protein